VIDTGVIDTGVVDTGRPTKRETRFDRILALAQQSFGTESAACVLRDHDVMRMTVSGAVAPDDLSWFDSMSATVVLQPGATIVGDTHADERFRNKPYVLGPPFMRFYAGFPLESPSGERIGTLCVFDSEPRIRSGVNSVLLRQLALMIQEELHASGANADSRTSPRSTHGAA
jgi:GAF domain-containing protein